MLADADGHLRQKLQQVCNCSRSQLKTQHLLNCQLMVAAVVGLPLGGLICCDSDQYIPVMPRSRALAKGRVLEFVLSPEPALQCPWSSF